MPQWKSHQRASRPASVLAPTKKRAGRDHPSKPRWDPVTRIAWTRRGTIALNQSDPALKAYFNDVELRMKLHVIHKDAFPHDKSTLFQRLFRKRSKRRSRHREALKACLHIGMFSMLVSGSKQAC